MAKVKMTAAVTLQEQLAADIYDMRIKAPEIAESAVPGQFVSLYSKDGYFYKFSFSLYSDAFMEQPVKLLCSIFGP